MRVLVVGASGAIGSARSSEKGAELDALDAEPVVLGALDARAVREVVATVQPDTPTASPARSIAAPTEGGAS